MLTKIPIIVIIFIGSHLFCCNNAISQITLNYEDYGIVVNPGKCNDTLVFTLTKNYPGYTLKLFLKDCRGEGFIELYNKKKQLFMTGHYVNGPDTLLKYSFAKQLGPPLDKNYYSVRKLKYLSPLKSGTWTIYNEKGKVTEKFEYEFKFR